MIQPYSQYDPQWKDKPLGSSGLFMGDSGCVETTVACGLRFRFNKNTNPGQLCDVMNQINGFPGGDFSWDKLRILYPDVQEILTGTTKNNGGNIDPAKAITDVKLNVASGMLVCLQVMLGTGNARHYVLAVETPDNGQWTIMDPWGGIVGPFNTRYGDPMTGLMGYRVLGGQPTTFPSYATVQDQTRGIAVSRCIDARYGKKDVLAVLIS